MEFVEQIVEKIVKFLEEREVVITKEELLKVLSTSPLPLKKAETNGEGCIYTANRGKMKNIPCGHPTVPEYEYCAECLKRKCVRKKLGLEPVETKAAPKKKTIKTEGSSPLKFKFTGATKTFVDKQALKLKLEPLKKSGHYYFPQENFILRKEPNGTYLVLGFGEEEVERTLNEKEKKKALELGLRVLHEVESEEEPSEE